VIEARKFSGLAVDTLVDLTKDNHADSTRFAAATALLDRGYGRPAQSLDLHLSADAITKRLSDMTDAELAALEARMITIPATLALEHADEPQADGDTEAGFARMIERAGRVAKLSFKAHPHMLRHACGYALANRGHDTRALQAYLGHKNIQHTVRYTALSPTRFKNFWRE
jgi:hypothetical protein